VPTLGPGARGGDGGVSAAGSAAAAHRADSGSVGTQIAERRRAIERRRAAAFADSAASTPARIVPDCVTAVSLASSGLTVAPGPRMSLRGAAEERPSEGVRSGRGGLGRRGEHRSPFPLCSTGACARRQPGGPSESLWGESPGSAGASPRGVGGSGPSRAQIAPSSERGGERVSINAQHSAPIARGMPQKANAYCHWARGT